MRKDPYFYFDPSRQGFPGNRETVIAKERTDLRWMHVIFALLPVAVAAFFVFMTNSDDPLYETVFLVGVIPFAGTFTLMYILAVIWSRRTIQVFKDGQVINGSITHSDVRRDEDKYLMRVRYTFTAPDGSTIKGKDNHFYPRSQQRPIPPERGTPVHVVYLNKRRHVIL